MVMIRDKEEEDKVSATLASSILKVSLWPQLTNMWTNF